MTAWDYVNRDQRLLASKVSTVEASIDFYQATGVINAYWHQRFQQRGPLPKYDLGTV